MKSSLLHKPIPFVDESPGSFLVRAAEYNGWKSPLALLHALDPDEFTYAFSIKTLMCHKQKWKIVTDLLGSKKISPIDVLYPKVGITIQSNLNFLGIELPYSDLRLAQPACCPECINENGYAPKIWDLRFIHFCIKHKRRLINCCSECGAKFTWNRQKLSHCKKCKISLDLSSIKKVNTKTTQFIQNIIDSQDQKGFEIFKESYDSLNRFFSFIDNPIDQIKLTDLTVSSIKKDNILREVISNNFKLANKAFGLHPRLLVHPLLRSSNTAFGTSDHITRKLIDILKTNKTIKPSSKKIKHKVAYEVDIINQILTTVSNPLIDPKNVKKYKNLNELRYNNDYCNVSDVIARCYIGKETFDASKVMTEGFTSLLVVPKPIEKLDKDYLTVKEAIFLCETNYSNINFSINCGFLKKDNFKISRYNAFLMPKKEVDNFCSTYIFSGTIAKQHNINSKNLSEQLIASGIKPVSGPSIDGNLSYVFKQDDIKGKDIPAIAKMTNYPTKTGRKKKDKHKYDLNDFTISTVAKKLGITSYQVSVLINKGKLERQKSNKRYRSVTAVSFYKLCAIENDASLISLEAVSKELDITRSLIIQRWLKTNFVETIDSGLNQYITKHSFEKIKRFHSKYITGAEAAKIGNTHTGHLRNLYKIGKLSTPKKLFYRSRSINFYKRNEVMKLFNELSN